jgi:AraC-like DNA-binding protein
MNELVAKLPASVGRAEQMMISGLFGHLLARVTRAAGIDDRLDVAREFLNLAEAGPTMERWRLQWFRSTESCAAHIDVDSSEHHITDIRVARMVRFIHRRYTDSTLKMRDVARVANLGPSHAARILRYQTGSSFHEHLHRCRAVVGRRLLVETPLSIKEIAADVGYAYPSQFSRRFKVVYGESPIAFRTGRMK